MLMREPTITNKKGSEKGRTICKISPFTDPFYYYPPSNRSAQPPLLDTPESRTLSEHSHPLQRRTATWPGGEEREKCRRPSQLRVLPLLATLPTPKCPPWKGNALRQERPSDARHCTISGTIFSLFLSIIQLHVYYKEHTSKLLTLNSESVILWSS